MDHVEYFKNKSAGKELKLPCSACANKTIHMVVLSYDLIGNFDDGDNYFGWETENQIIQCQGCKTVSFRRASSNSEDIVHNNETGEADYLIEEYLFPTRIEGIRGLGDDILYLPSNIKRIYEEILQALFNQLRVLTGIGLRVLIEAVCKEKNASGKNLFDKIDDLVEKKILTPSGAEVLHKIRTLGNSSAHEVTPHNDQQLRLAINVIEHLLQDVYILPKRVLSEFKSNNNVDK